LQSSPTATFYETLPFAASLQGSVNHRLVCRILFLVHAIHGVPRHGEARWIKAQISIYRAVEIAVERLAASAYSYHRCHRRRHRYPDRFEPLAIFDRLVTPAPGDRSRAQAVRFRLKPASDKRDQRRRQDRNVGDGVFDW
jgi:hypothetical protein